MVHGGARQMQANVDITIIWGGETDKSYGNKTRQTSRTTHSREPRQSTD